MVLNPITAADAVKVPRYQDIVSQSINPVTSKANMRGNKKARYRDIKKRRRTVRGIHVKIDTAQPEEESQLVSIKRTNLVSHVQSGRAKSIAAQSDEEEVILTDTKNLFNFKHLAEGMRNSKKEVLKSS